MALPSLKHARNSTTRSSTIVPNKRVKVAARGTSTRPAKVENSQQLSQRLSPRKALGTASQPSEAPTFESQLRESQLEGAIAASTEGSKAVTVATAEDSNSGGKGFDEHLTDDYNGIDWTRLPKYMKPLATQRGKKSWVYQHGYRVALHKDPSRIFFICRICHQRKIIDAGGPGVYETTQSTSTSARHLEQQKRGHNHQAPGKAIYETKSWLRSVLKDGRVKVSQDVTNELAGFDIQKFRLAAVSWLVENNHPLKEFETPAFRQLIAAANPQAETALWSAHSSVSLYVMRLYDYMLPRVVAELSQSLSKIHISFDSWTTKGGKRGFLGVVSHYVDCSGDVKDLPIALPQLIGTHSGERMTEVVSKILQQFGISPLTVSYFVLDNARNNDTAVLNLAQQMGFIAPHRRLRCGPHTLNLIGQTLLQGNNDDAFDNDVSQLADESNFMRN